MIRHLVIVFSLLLVGCAPAASQTTTVPAPSSSIAQPKRVTAAIMSSPQTISRDRLSAGSGTYPGGDALEGLMNGGMTYTNDRDELVPQIAQAVPTTENGLWKVMADGTMETTWNIRPNAYWHDGSPITATDFLFTAALAQDKELPGFGARDWDYVSDVRAVDDKTVAVTWKTTYIRANALFLQVRPEHLLGDAYRSSDKTAVLQGPYWIDQYVGAGPFKLKAFVPDSYLTVTANDAYFLGRPKIDEITVKFIPAPTTLVANVLASDVSLTLGRNLSIQQAQEIRTHWTNGTAKIDFNN